MSAGPVGVCTPFGDAALLFNCPFRGPEGGLFNGDGILGAARKLLVWTAGKFCLGDTWSPWNPLKRSGWTPVGLLGGGPGGGGGGGGAPACGMCRIRSGCIGVLGDATIGGGGAGMLVASEFSN